MRNCYQNAPLPPMAGGITDPGDNYGALMSVMIKPRITGYSKIERYEVKEMSNDDNAVIESKMAADLISFSTSSC
jgi:hypothetical protein